MRRTTLGTFALAVVALGGCGGGTHFADRPRPPAPVNMTVYVNDQRISVSPGSVGAGPVVFIITNQASNAESLEVTTSGGTGSPPLANTGPISPQATAQLSVDLQNPGDYTVGVTPAGSTQAAAAVPTGIRPALIKVGSPRASSNNDLQQP
jgi:hypothetical protein